MSREYFIAYFDYLENWEALSDAECGRLFRAALRYGITGEATELNGNERFLFPTVKKQIDRDTKKYEEKCIINKENGRYGVLGGRPKKDKIPKKPSGFSETLKEEKEKEKEEEEDKEDNINAQNFPQTDEAFDETETIADKFERFYREYPKKKNKGKAYRWFVQHQPGSELIDEMVAFLKVAKQTIDWLKSGGKYIPHPATWLNAKGWENEINPSEIADVSEKSPSFLLAKILYERLRNCKLAEDEIKKRNISTLITRWAVVIDEYLSSERTPQREDKVYSAIRKFTKNNYWKNIIVDAESLIKNINYIK